MHRYLITIDGYTPEEFVAETASKARYKAFVAFCESTRRLPFKDFLRRIYVLYLGPAEDTTPPVAPSC